MTQVKGGKPIIALSTATLPSDEDMLHGSVSFAWRTIRDVPLDQARAVTPAMLDKAERFAAGSLTVFIEGIDKGRTQFDEVIPTVLAELMLIHWLREQVEGKAP